MVLGQDLPRASLMPWARLHRMAPPLDKPSQEAPEHDAAGQAWLDSLTAEIDAMTPEEWAEIGRREDRIKRELDEIEAGRHPLCLAQPAT